MQERDLTFDGRSTSLVDMGTSGLAVVVHDGYGSRLVTSLAVEAANDAGVRIVAPDRPGFWRSTPGKDDPLRAWPGVLEGLLDQLEIETCAVLGASAGTPFALAAASNLADRVHRVAIVGPFGPLNAADDLSDMLAGQRRSFAMAARWPNAGTVAMIPMAKLARRRPELLLRVLTSQRPDVDAERMKAPEVRQRMLPLVGELFGDGQAARAELRAIVADWTDLAAETLQPTRIWVGTDDTVHPASMAAALTKHLPRAVVVEVQGGFFAVMDRAAEILSWCRSGMVPA